MSKFNKILDLCYNSNMIKQGDTIGIIALAGNCDKEKIMIAVKNLESLGYKIKLSKNIFDQNNYLAGSDEDRVAELHNFFLNPEIKLILNARGGYGSIRLINKINYDIIKSNPKPFCGFSDITALLLMFYRKCGLVTYHGPMLCSDFVEINDVTINNFLKVFGENDLEFVGTTIFKEGNAEGIIWGGNLSTVVSLCGLDFIPDEDFIFFAEDLNEPAYKIDRMFTQLFNIDNFAKNCRAIVLGDFLGVDNQEYLEDYFKTLALPVVGGLKITHRDEKISLPVGKFAQLCNNKLRINNGN